MSDSSTPMAASEASRIAATHPHGGKYRREGEPVVGASGVTGRHVDDTTEGLLLDACAAAELLARHAESWSPEQILVHPELAKLALAEASRAQEATAKPRRRFRTGRTADAQPPLQQAADLLAQAHTRIAFLDA